MHSYAKQQENINVTGNNEDMIKTWQEIEETSYMTCF